MKVKHQKEVALTKTQNLVLMNFIFRVFFAVEQQWPYPSKHALVGPQWVPVSELWDLWENYPTQAPSGCANKGTTTVIALWVCLLKPRWGPCSLAICQWEWSQFGPFEGCPRTYSSFTSLSVGNPHRKHIHGPQWAKLLCVCVGTQNKG